jgi:hypothetical protein
MCSLGSKANLLRLPFLDNDTKQLPIVQVERLKADRVRESVFLAHFLSNLVCNVGAFWERKVLFLRRTFRLAPEVDYSDMRNRLFTPSPQGIQSQDEGWLDIDSAATVEVTSEAKEYPVESALVSGETRGWRAADSGTQTIRLIFDEPQKLTRISLLFEEGEIERTQEFVLRWSPDCGRSFREIVRQQWNFSPPNTKREVEEYQVELSDVTVLELIIVPDISRGAARASLKSLRLS